MARDVLDVNDNIELRDAVRDLLRQTEPGQYEWHRRQASTHGRIWIGLDSAPAFKLERHWYVKASDITSAQEREETRKQRLEQATRDYEHGIVHGADGETTRTTWGGYTLHGDFRFVWDDVEVGRRKSDGWWVCYQCNVSVKTEHNGEECHRCADWTPCRNDCTLSRIECPKCGRERPMNGNYPTD